MGKWYRVRVKNRARAREYSSSFVFEHNHTLSGKKTVTGSRW